MSQHSIEIKEFQSTPSGGKATCLRSYPAHCAGVSIHAFRGEGDVDRRLTRWQCRGFNPRLPGGRRHNTRVQFAGSGAFQSTPSGGKATRLPLEEPHVLAVSIHAFRGEGDLAAERVRRGDCGFNPRLPGGRRHFHTSTPTSAPLRFQSTPSGGKATCRTREY